VKAIRITYWPNIGKKLPVEGRDKIVVFSFFAKFPAKKNYCWYVQQMFEEEEFLEE
jgi:hypothetical protein